MNESNPTSHHKVTKWLASFLQPVLEQFSNYSIKDSFTFARTLQELVLDIYGHLTAYLLMYLLMRLSANVQKFMPVVLNLWVITHKGYFGILKKEM